MLKKIFVILLSTTSCLLSTSCSSSYISEEKFILSYDEMVYLRAGKEYDNVTINGSYTLNGEKTNIDNQVTDITYDDAKKTYFINVLDDIFPLGSNSGSNFVANFAGTKLNYTSNGYSSEINEDNIYTRINCTFNQLGFTNKIYLTTQNSENNLVYDVTLSNYNKSGEIVYSREQFLDSYNQMVIARGSTTFEKVTANGTIIEGTKTRVVDWDYPTISYDEISKYYKADSDFIPSLIVGFKNKDDVFFAFDGLISPSAFTYTLTGFSYLTKDAYASYEFDSLGFVSHCEIKYETYQYNIIYFNYR